VLCSSNSTVSAELDSWLKERSLQQQTSALVFWAIECIGHGEEHLSSRSTRHSWSAPVCCILAARPPGKGEHRASAGQG